jgi:hypothetical protein
MCFLWEAVGFGAGVILRGISVCLACSSHPHGQEWVKLTWHICPEFLIWLSQKSEQLLGRTLIKERY